MTKEISSCYGNFTTTPSIYHERECETCPRHDDCIMIVRHSDDHIKKALHYCDKLIEVLRGAS
jgi:hypothetical protein